MFHLDFMNKKWLIHKNVVGTCKGHTLHDEITDLDTFFMVIIQTTISLKIWIIDANVK